MKVRELLELLEGVNPEAEVKTSEDFQVGSGTWVTRDVPIIDGYLYPTSKDKSLVTEVHLERG